MSVLLDSWDHAYISSCHFSLGVEEAQQDQFIEELQTLREEAQNHPDL